MIDTIGSRIARIRVEHGWTQQYVADRIAISRVAVSHIESGLTVPGERTITLLAGFFKIEPLILVEGTTYPRAKSDWLPFSVCCYTQLELDLSLLEKDLHWLELLQDTRILNSDRNNIYNLWSKKLSELDSRTYDPNERKLIQETRDKLRQINVSKS